MSNGQFYSLGTEFHGPSILSAALRQIQGPLCIRMGFRVLDRVLLPRHKFLGGTRVTS